MKLPHNILEIQQDFSVQFSSTERLKGTCPSTAMKNCLLFTGD